MVGAVAVYLGFVQLAYNYSMTPAWPAATVKADPCAVQTKLLSHKAVG